MHTRGFTLLETLLATVLLAVLMVGVMAVIAQISQPISDPAEAHTLPDSTGEAWLRLMRDDLLSATTVDVGVPNQFTLEGFTGIDPTTGERTHRPVRVRYVINQIAGDSWLLREQLALDEGPPRVSQRGLVGRGATHLQLTPETDVGGTSLEHTGRSHAGRWRLQVWADDPDTPAVDRVLALSLRRGAADE